MYSDISFLWWLLLAALVCAGICAALGQRKNIPTAESASWGFFLGVIGIVIVACMEERLPAAPGGMSAHKCARCNAVQNVEDGSSSFECWQCHQTNSVVPTRPVGPVSAGPRRSVRCPTCQNSKKIPVEARSFYCPYCRVDVAASH
jgi:uncharacterized CHY-type Zn-finger protein